VTIFTNRCSVTIHVSSAFWSQDSVVTIVTTLDDLGFESQHGQEIYLKCADQFWGQPILQLSWYGCLIPRTLG
jgi:hypothetical protein